MCRGLFLYISIVFVLVFRIWPSETLKFCDPRFCNNAGICRVVNGKTNCECIDEDVYSGVFCNVLKDNCDPNPCMAGAKCTSVLGQYYCSPCPDGVSGQKCEHQIPDLYKSVILITKQYTQYAQKIFYVIIVRDLGTVPFEIELATDMYLIDNFTVDPRSSSAASHFRYCPNLPAALRKRGFQNLRGIPRVGYFRLRCATFYTVGYEDMKLRVTLPSNNTLIYEKSFKVYIMRPLNFRCMPHVYLLYGESHRQPLNFRVDRYNSLQAYVKEPCTEFSKFQFCFQIKNSIGNIIFRSYKCSKSAILQIPPYDFDFAMKLEVKAFMIYIEAREYIKTECYKKVLRAYVFLPTYPVMASIVGGDEKQVGYNQALLLNGRHSRGQSEDVEFNWDCVSESDPDNKACHLNMGTTNNLLISSGQLKPDKTYKFTVKVRHSSIQGVKSFRTQIVNVVHNKTLQLNAQIVRNVKLRGFDATKSIHMTAQCLNCRGTRIQQRDSLIYKWYLEDSKKEIGNGRRLIYWPTGPTNLSIGLKVTEKKTKLEGLSIYRLAPIPLPSGGQCELSEQNGTEYLTDFELSCNGYESPNQPLIYLVYTAGVPLRYSQQAKVRFQLPAESKGIEVRICDNYFVCTKEKFDILVDKYDAPTERELFIDFLKTSNLKYLLSHGDGLKALLLFNIMQRNAQLYMKRMVVNEIGNYFPHDLLQICQFIYFVRNLLVEIAPLDDDEALLFRDLFIKVNQGLRFLLTTGSAVNLRRSTYETLNNNMFDVFHKFIESGTHVLPTLKPTWYTRQYDNLLLEEFAEMPPIDNRIASISTNWLKSFTVLDDTFSLLGSIGAYSKLRVPEETHYDKDNDDNHLKIFAFEDLKQFVVNTKDIQVTISNESSYFLQCHLKTTVVFIQIMSLKNFPFWWAPTDQHFETKVLSLKLFNGEDTMAEDFKSFTYRIDFTIADDIWDKTNQPQSGKKQIVNFEEDPSTGFFEKFNERIIHFIDIPSNALASITFLSASHDLRIIFKKHGPPSSFLLRQSNIVVKQNLENNEHTIQNDSIENRTMRAYIGVMAAQPFEGRVEYSFKVKAIICYRWNLNFRDPFWTPANCRVVTANASFITCECNHFSYMVADVRDLRTDVQKNEKTFYMRMPVNWTVFLFYFGIFGSLFLAILFIFCCHYRSKEIIILDQASPSKEDGFLIYITTGSVRNAGTTSNVILYFQTSYGFFRAQIFQDPHAPHFSDCSTTVVHISSRRLGIPFILRIRIDNTGRYPSWFCESIMIVDIKSKSKFFFFIHNWVTTETLNLDSKKSGSSIFSGMRSKGLTWYLILVHLFKNWFKFEPVFGPWQYGATSMNVLQRSCVWLSQIAVLVMIVSIYFGPTTVANYEQERERFTNFVFSASEFFLLVAVCFIAMSLIRYIYIFLVFDK